jgi:hypothetical protein
MTESIIKYAVGCPSCMAEGKESQVQYAESVGFHCPNGHSFTGLPSPDSQSTAVEPTPPAPPLGGLTGSEAEAQGADSHVGGPDATDVAPLALATAIKDSTEVKICADASIEVILPTGDVVIAATIRFDYLGHLRDEAGNSEISLSEYIQRHLNWSIENGHI